MRWLWELKMNSKNRKILTVLSHQKEIQKNKKLKDVFKITKKVLDQFYGMSVTIQELVNANKVLVK